MKIEKLNDNQIRCTLGKKDLADRNLKVSELAYGSDKARELFRDMMQQASYEFGFEAEDIPLMIEAIPVSADCIVLIVTKVDEPEELDTRFSRFSSQYDDDYYDYPDDADEFDDMEEIDAGTPTPSATDELKNADSDVIVPDDSVANDVLNLFSKVRDYINSNISDSGETNFVSLKDSLAGKAPVNVETDGSSSGTGAVLKASKPARTIRIYSFDSFDKFSGAAGAVSSIYKDKNSLYLNGAEQRFYLTLSKESTAGSDYNKTCNILSEYGTKEPLGLSSVYYFDEHYRCIIRDRAIQVASRYM